MNRIEGVNMHQELLKPNRLERLLVTAEQAAWVLCGHPFGSPEFELGVALYNAVERLRE